MPSLFFVVAMYLRLDNTRTDIGRQLYGSSNDVCDGVEYGDAQYRTDHSSIQSDDLEDSVLHLLCHVCVLSDVLDDVCV